MRQRRDSPEFAGVERLELSDLIGLCNPWARRLISVVHLRVLAFALTISQEYSVPTPSYLSLYQSFVQKLNGVFNCLGRFCFPPNHGCQGEDVMRGIRNLVRSNAGLPNTLMLRLD